jgi:hypothetical protein
MPSAKTVPARAILDFGFWILDFGFWILDFGWKSPSLPTLPPETLP